MEQESLKNKNVLIVGGTSGIGLSTAKLAKAEGANVTVMGFNPVQAEKVVRENGLAGFMTADITKEEVIKAALSEMPRVDHLVLLAGSFVFGTVAEADVQYLKRAFDERVWGSVYVLRALGDRLSRDASVTFTSGILADRPGSGTAILAAASAAMEAFARGLAIEQAPRRFNTVSPGTTDTPLLEKALGANRDAFLNTTKEKVPLHRVATPDHVASAIMFLMKNEIMNGETIHVDGGQRLV